MPSPHDISRLTLSHPDGITPILVGEGALAAAQDELSAWLAGRTAFVVTTARVLAFHGERLGPLSRCAARWVILEVEDGEEAKSVESAGRLWNQMLAAGGKSDSPLLTFRGGRARALRGLAPRP